MIDVEQHGSVMVIRMARAVFGRPLYWTAAYWIDGLLIDTGPVCTANELLRTLQKVTVRQIAITHAHEDHIGGLAAIHERFPDAPIYVSNRSIPLIEQPELLGMQRYRRMIWGTPRLVNGVHSLDEVEDQIHTPEFTVRAIETPGHSRDHVSYFEPRYRWLFCGDAFVGGRDTAWTPEFDMFGMVSSMRTMASLRPERLFPGSGTVRRTPLPDLHARIGDLVQLAAEVDRLDAGGYTSPEIVEMLFDGEPRIKFWTMGHFSAANLVEACRQYNAVVAPRGLERSPAPPRPRRNRSDDLTDSSANRSSDPDVRR